MKKINEFSGVPQDPDSVQKKMEFWKNMNKQLEEMKRMLDKWQEEDHRNENK